ncbi:PREDICTED: wings apart-like protein homolog [Acropora digitifera]|uniref:wings apart-like protein homolog n=1 Tax=Acropora digitifera TaxID=70779 RepID=UPI00077ABDD3|nr:PREDICTED: wings apart-like protein homolog [Acropora digitifera]
MPKYGSKTYGRNRDRDSTVSVAFDELQKSENSNLDATTKENSFIRKLPRKSPWARTSRLVESAASLTKGSALDVTKTRKKRKLAVIEEKDPFAFDEDDVTSLSRKKSTLVRSDTTKQPVINQLLSTELTDKSTDDEAYSSSQELSESSQGGDSKITKNSKKKSPFKSFLKNNDKSLSPKKDKTLRRLSALPTTADFSEDSQDDTATDISNAVGFASWPRQKKEHSENVVRVKRTDKPVSFFDDVEYLLDGLKKSRSMATRCLSALDFASHCRQPSFRVSLRAHGISPKIFASLGDAPSDKCLALCTSAITLMLSQDRQNADLDRSDLELMMKLLAVDSSKQPSQALKDHNKYVTKVRFVPVNVFFLKPASLVCESLLSLTSQRTGEWFKEEIRILRGLDHIMNIGTQTIEQLLTEHNASKLQEVSVAKLRKMTRCMRLLENVTIQNSTNQEYMVYYEKGSFVAALVRLMQWCLDALSNGILQKKTYSKPDIAFEDCFFSILKVFLNLTHNFEAGSSYIGRQDGFLSALLSTVLQLPQFVTENKKFDLHVLTLELLINLVEYSKQNIATLVQLQASPCLDSENTDSQGGQCSSIEALVKLFLIREEAARNTDEMTSGLSTEEESSQESLRQTKDGGWICGEDIDISVDEDHKKCSEIEEEDVPLEIQIGKALQKAGKHMEDSVVAAYLSLLLGCILQENMANQSFVHSLLPDGDFSLLVNVLRKFLRFIKLTSGTSGHAIEKIVKVLEGCQQN